MAIDAIFKTPSTTIVSPVSPYCSYDGHQDKKKEHEQYMSVNAEHGLMNPTCRADDEPIQRNYGIQKGYISHFSMKSRSFTSNHSKNEWSDEITIEPDCHVSKKLGH